MSLNFEDTVTAKGLDTVLNLWAGFFGLTSSKVDLGMTIPEEVMVSSYTKISDK